MIKYATAEALQRRARRPIGAERNRILVEAKARAATGSTFLSHSTADHDVLPDVVQLLKDHGTSVYLDKTDSSLPPATSRETAATLRQRIRVCNRFILLVSPNSRNSRWTPWELGVSDGIKAESEIAIFPIAGSTADTTWATQEYLGLYRRIVFDTADVTGQQKWVVYDHRSRRYQDLGVWLR